MYLELLQASILFVNQHEDSSINQENILALMLIFLWLIFELILFDPLFQTIEYLQLQFQY